MVRHWFHLVELAVTYTGANHHVRAFVERIERLETEISELNADKSDIYKEARGMGFDVKALRKVVAQRKLDPADREERDAMFDLYWHAVHGTGMGDATRVHVHEANSYADEKGRGDITVVDREDEDGNRIRVTVSPEIAEILARGADAETGEITDEPEAAAEVAGDYLREPVAAEQGQIVREGDAPRETDRTSGDASRPDAEFTNSQASSSQPASSAGEIVPSSPISPVPPFDIGDIPACLDRRKRTDTGAHP